MCLHTISKILVLKKNFSDGCRLWQTAVVKLTLSKETSVSHVIML